jgi:hypothetical protein
MLTDNIFIKNLNEIYNNISIYRSIIVVNNIKEKKLYINKLLQTNHQPFDYNKDDIIDYNYRLFIVDKKDFNDLISKLVINEYNLIAFSYNINNITSYIDYFLNISNNNINNIYIHNIDSINNNIISNKYFI